jgi:hypothetical protein
VPVTKVPGGPRKTAISRDRWLVVVTLFNTRYEHVLSVRHLPVTFLGLFVTLDR